MAQILEQIHFPCEQYLERARRHTARLVMPTRALGRLHETAEKLCAIGETDSPLMEKKTVMIFAETMGSPKKG